MSKFKTVLSEDWLPEEFTSGNEIPVFSKMVDRKSLRSIVEQAEKAILAKLAEQEPETYIILDKEGFEVDLVPSTKDYVLKEGETFMPLYAHPIPTIEQEPVIYLYGGDLYSDDGGDINDHIREHGTPLYTLPMPCLPNTIGETAYAPESEESDNQELPPTPEPDVFGYKDSYSKSLLIEYAKSAIENYRATKSPIPDAKKMIVPEGWQLVPTEPTEEMWDGLARKILLAFDFNCKSPNELINFLKMSGFELPEAVLKESEMKNLDHVISKGTRAVILYKAMLAASPKYTENISE